MADLQYALQDRIEQLKDENEKLKGQVSIGNIFIIIITLIAIILAL